MSNGIFARRSVRQYQDRMVSRQMVERIIQAGMQAPSAHGRRPWEMVIVNDKKILSLLSEMSQYSGAVKGAAIAIVNCVNMMLAQPDGKANRWWIQDLAACTQNELIELTEQGLGGVWLGCYPSPERIAYVQQTLDLKGELIPFSIVALGYPQKPLQIYNMYRPERVHWDYYIE